VVILDFLPKEDETTGVSYRLTYDCKYYHIEKHILSFLVSKKRLSKKAVNEQLGIDLTKKAQKWNINTTRYCEEIIAYDIETARKIASYRHGVRSVDEISLIE